MADLETAPSKISSLPHPNGLAERFYLILRGLGAFIFIGFTLTFSQFTVDDAYITFRYAKNFIDHGIWNWNADYQVVEAYTSFTYAVLSLIPYYLHINPAIFFKLLSVILVYTILYQLKIRIQSKRVFALALLLVVFYPYFYIHLYSGLETPLFIFLIFELNYLLTFDNSTPTRERALYMVMLLLPLTRPEGLVYSLSALFAHLYINKDSIREKPFFLSLLAIAASYFGWRYFYFGYLFPNSFYIKTVNSASLSNLTFNLILSRIYLISIVASLFLIKDTRFKLLGLSSVLLFLFVYSPSTLQMNYADRFAFQIFIPILLSALLFINRSTVTYFYIIFLYVVLATPSLSETRHLITYHPRAIQSHLDLGMRLSLFKNQGYTLMLGDAGLIPYYSEWKTYDLLGLADTEIAHKGLTLEYLYRTSPDLILLYSTTPDPADTRIGGYNQIITMDYIESSNAYEFTAASKWKEDFYLVSFLKKDIEDYEEIRQTLLANQAATKNFSLSLWDLLSLKYLSRAP